MDRGRIEASLREIEHHIARGLQHLDRQRQIIAELERDGHDTAAAVTLLATLEETQRLHVASYKTIQKELRSL
jgi:hypothetical protein